MEVEDDKQVKIIICQVISTMRKMKHGKEREYWVGSLKQSRQNDIEHLLDASGERTCQAEGSAGAKALRQRPLAL